MSGEIHAQIHAFRTAARRRVEFRSFTPHRAHATVDVIGAVSDANACLIDGSQSAGIARVSQGTYQSISVQHPTGEFTCVLTVDENRQVISAAILQTALKLMDGYV